VSNSGTLLIGDRVRLVSTIATLELAVEPGATLDIGDGVFINYGCSIGATKLVRIGSRCTIGTHVIVIDNDFHRVEPERRDERPLSQPIILEENVWLGARVVVLRGVTIGAHSVIGAGSVVARNIPPRVVAAGVPAKVVRSL
jgi:maltose O-acetyltransferase